jgi:hypothetical protein
VIPACADVAPPLIEVRPGHRAACIHHQEGAA